MRPSAIGFSVVLEFSEAHSSWQSRGVKTVSWLKPLDAYQYDLPSRGELDSARRIYSALWRLPREGAVWRAVRTLWLALISESPEARYLQLWTALEALFGPQDGAEITYRLAERIALFLHGRSSETAEIARRTKKAYSLRSKVVHGRSIENLKVDDAERLLRTRRMSCVAPYSRSSLILRLSLGSGETNARPSSKVSCSERMHT